MALNRDKRNALVTVAALIAVVAFLQIVGYGRVTHRSDSARDHAWQRRATTAGPEGRACISHICVFFDVTFAEEFAGRIIFLLYDKKVTSCPLLPHHELKVDFHLRIMQHWPLVLRLGED